MGTVKLDKYVTYFYVVVHCPFLQKYKKIMLFQGCWINMRLILCCHTLSSFADIQKNYVILRKFCKIQKNYVILRKLDKLRVQEIMQYLVCLRNKV